MTLADDFKGLWMNPNVSNEERKRMIRLLIENVLITQLDDHIHLVIRFRAGTTRELDIQKGKKSYETWRTPEEAMEIIRNSLDNFMPSSQIAQLLNSKGLKTGKNLSYTRILVESIIKTHKLKPLSQRITDLGFVPQKEILQKTGLSRKQIRKLRDSGIIKNYKTTEKTEYFYKLEDFSAYMAR